MNGTFSAEVRQVLEHLTERRSVVLEGRRGSGRSTILQRVVADLERRGRHVLTATGHRAFTSQSYAGLEMLGFSVGKTPHERQPLVVADMVARELVDGEVNVVTLDDVELFDRISLDILDVALDRIGRPWVATIAPPSDTADGVRQFLDRWPSVRIGIEPLRFDEMRAIVTEHLGGPASADVIGRVLTLSSGNPRLAAEIIESSSLSGDLHVLDEVWHWRQIGSWNRHLESVVNGLLGDLSRDEVDALNAMAIIGAEPADRILQVVDSDTLASLDRRGMVTAIGTDPEDRWLAVDPPLLGDYFRHRSDAVESLAVARRTTAILGSRTDGETPTTQERTLADVRVGLQRENAREDAIIALHFTEQRRVAARSRFQRWREERTPFAALDFLESASDIPQQQEQIEEVFAETLDDGTDTDAFRLGVIQTSWLAFTRADRAQTDAVFTRLASRPGREAEVAAIRLVTEALLDAVPADAARRLKDLRGASGNNDVYGFISLATVIVDMITGEPTSALDAVAEAAGRESVAGLLGFCEGLTLIFAGRPDEALIHATRRRELARASLDLGSLCLHTYVCVLALMALGMWSDAERYALGILSLDRPLGFPATIYDATIRLCALIAIDSGEFALADSLIAEARVAGSAIGALPGTNTVTLDALRQLPEDATAFRDDIAVLTGHTLARGYRAGAAFTSMLAFMREPSERVLSIVERAMTPDLARVNAEALRMGRALVAGNVELVEEIAVEYDGLGVVQVLGGMLRGASARAMQDNDPALARRLSAIEGALVARRPEASGPARTGASHRASVLSAREREVALLAGELSNSMIADRLVISVRTVEKHVANAMKRTGVASRRSLFELVSSTSG